MSTVRERVQAFAIGLIVNDHAGLEDITNALEEQVAVLRRGGTTPCEDGTDDCETDYGSDAEDSSSSALIREHLRSTIICLLEEHDCYLDDILTCLENEVEEIQDLLSSDEENCDDEDWDDEDCEPCDCGYCE